MTWEIVIGIEVHAQVLSISKLFSTAKNNFGDKPNGNVNMFDISLPGQLPTLNELCVKQAVKTALGINAKVNQISGFDRKHYFYPDLPSGYQITQFYKPIASNGFIIIEDDNGNEKRINITSMHLEQDAGKLIVKENQTLVDLNRAGCPLMEIISAPDIRSINEAAKYVEKLRSILVYLGTCDGNMQEGSLRADVNVSVRKKGEEKFGTRCEIKNLNSIRFLRKAVKYEVERQINLIENGEKVIQQTMLFDEETGETKPIRSKADAIDYMYFADPDLPELVVSQEEIDQIKSEITELPDEKKSRFIEEYNLSQAEATILTEDKNTANFFEKVVLKTGKEHAKQVSNWITSELFGYLNENNLNINQSKITDLHIVELVELISSGTISRLVAKDIFKECCTNDIMPKELVDKKGLQQISNADILSKTVDEVLLQMSSKVEEFKSGKVEIFGWLVGQIMKATKGKGNPALINSILKDKLSR